MKEDYEEYGCTIIQANNKDDLIIELIELLYTVAGYYQVSDEE